MGENIWKSILSGYIMFCVLCFSILKNFSDWEVTTSSLVCPFTEITKVPARSMPLIYKLTDPEPYVLYQALTTGANIPLP